MTDTCAKCRAEFVPSGCGTGYAVTSSGTHLCYACADEMQREEMRERTSYCAYLSGDGSSLTTWSGGQLARVVSEHKDSGTGFRGTRLTHIRAVTPDGSVWYGKGAGRNMIISIHRSKQTSRTAA